MAGLNLSTLATEIVIAIVEKLVEKSTNPPGKKQNLVNLCLVSRKFLLITQPILYRTVSFPPYFDQELGRITFPHVSIRKFLRALIVNPELAKYVTRLKLCWDGEEMDKPESGWVYRRVPEVKCANSNCPNKLEEQYRFHSAVSKVLEMANRLQSLVLMPNYWFRNSVLSAATSGKWRPDCTLLPRGFHGLRYLELGNGLERDLDSMLIPWGSGSSLPATVTLAFFFIPGLETLRLMKIHAAGNDFLWEDYDAAKYHGTSTVTDLWIGNCEMNAAMLENILRLPQSLKRLGLHEYDGFIPSQVRRALEVVQSSLEELHITEFIVPEDRRDLFGSLQDFTALKVLRTCISLLLGPTTSERMVDLLPPQLEKLHLSQSSTSPINDSAKFCVTGSLRSLSSLTSVRLPASRLRYETLPQPPLSELLPPQISELFLTGTQHIFPMSLLPFPNLKRVTIPALNFTSASPLTIQNLDLRSSSFRHPISRPEAIAHQNLDSSPATPYTIALLHSLPKFTSLTSLRFPAHFLLNPTANPSFPPTLQTLVLATSGFDSSHPSLLPTHPLLKSTLHSLPTLLTLIAPLHLLLPAPLSHDPTALPSLLPHTLTELKLLDTLTTSSFSRLHPPFPASQLIHLTALATHKTTAHTRLRTVVYELNPIGTWMTALGGYPVRGEEVERVRRICEEHGVSVRGVWDLGPAWAERFLVDAGGRWHGWLEWGGERGRF